MNYRNRFEAFRVVTAERVVERPGVDAPRSAGEAVFGRFWSGPVSFHGLVSPRALAPLFCGFPGSSRNTENGSVPTKEREVP